MNAPADEKNDSLAFISCYFLHPFFEIIDLICGDSVDFKKDVALHKSGKGSPTCGFDVVHQKTRLIFFQSGEDAIPEGKFPNGEFKSFLLILVEFIGRWRALVQGHVQVQRSPGAKSTEPDRRIGFVFFDHISENFRILRSIGHDDLSVYSKKKIAGLKTCSFRRGFGENLNNPDASCVSGQFERL